MHKQEEGSWDEKEPTSSGVLGLSNIISFDWSHQWLKGHEYRHMLDNVSLYCTHFGFHCFDLKKHPKEIYSCPTNGLIYFIRGRGVGQDFGFPRMEQLKKKFRWKKMNFTTHLPKRKPEVTYVVASATRVEHADESENVQFRMHAVIPYYEGNNSSQDNQYILCHVRATTKNKQKQKEFYDCFTQEQIDFYKLLSFLHNRSAPDQEK